jgi:hypothetical protein
VPVRLETAALMVKVRGGVFLEAVSPQVAQKISVAETNAEVHNFEPTIWSAFLSVVKVA